MDIRQIMVASIAEDNIRKFFRSVCRYDNVKIFGFQWNTPNSADSSWFVFSDDGVSGRWYVESDIDSDIYSYQEDGGYTVPDLVREVEPSDWSHISPGHSPGLIGHDFRGCYLGGLDFTYTKFIDCVFDDICMSPKPSNTRATFVGCKWLSAHESVNESTTTTSR